jgi:hypothetical protein
MGAVTPIRRSGRGFEGIISWWTGRPPAALAHRRAASGTDAINVLQLIDELPDMVLPYLTRAASRRSDIPARAVRNLMRCWGDLFLERPKVSRRLAK